MLKRRWPTRRIWEHTGTCWVIFDINACIFSVKGKSKIKSEMKKRKWIVLYIYSPASPLHNNMTLQNVIPVIIFSSTHPGVLSKNLKQSWNIFQWMTDDEDYNYQDWDSRQFLLTFSQNRLCTSSESLEKMHRWDIKLRNPLRRLIWWWSIQTLNPLVSKMWFTVLSFP